MTKTICFVAAPRTGTNHFCNILKNYTEINSHFEIFHKLGAMGLSDDDVASVSKDFQKNFAGREDPALVASIKLQPGRFVESLQRRTQDLNKSVLSFKVFPGQLPDELFLNEILLREDVVPIFILRRLIDSYISTEKAKKLKSWHTTDTTDQKISLRADEFLAWRREVCEWYQGVEGVLRREEKLYSSIIYENDINNVLHNTLEAFRISLKPLGMDLTPVKEVELDGLQKQDNELIFQNKVANWEEFSADLKALGVYHEAIGYAI